VSTAEFPTRTAGEVTLPNGDTVWTCTLNTPLKDQADARSHRYAANECRGLLKGGSDYPGVLAKVHAMDAEQQAAYLVQQQNWRLNRETLDKYPDPEEPQKGDAEPDAYAKAVGEWEDACKAAAEKRKQDFETRYEAEKKKNLALSNRARVEACCNGVFNFEYSRAFVERLAFETLFRAVRLQDDHTARYFASAEAVEDADDEVLKVLNDFYFRELETVKAEDIPT
jgi:hypothetical protein